MTSMNDDFPVKKVFALTTEARHAAAGREVMEAANAGAYRHRCAVCPRPIQRGVLMCLAHWKLVPLPEQLEVYRSWGVMQRAPWRSGYGRVTRSAYTAARDKAIAIATQAIAAQSAALERTESPTGEAP